MDEADSDHQRARERERAGRARDREWHALEMKRAAERAADAAPTPEAAEMHRDEAARRERAAQLHRKAIELQEQHLRGDAR